MPMTPGEQYSVFLLLATQRGTTRQLLEGSHNINGSVVGAAGPAPDAATMQARAIAVLTGLGVDPADLTAPVNLGMLFDHNGINNVTADQTRIALALAMTYSDTCPKRAVESEIVRGIRQVMP